MASTEPDEGPHLHGDPRHRKTEVRAELDAAVLIRPLTQDDLDAAVALSQSAHWNQNANDWSMMLRLGQGWGIDAADDAGQLRLAASIVVLPYGEKFAWTSMVLVLPEFRRRGYAQLMLRHALSHLESEGRAALLDATPAGHAVYVQEGFADTWGFARYRREAGRLQVERPVAPQSRPLREDDWPALDALDRQAFGASRQALLRTLAQRLPQAARVVEHGGRLRGYVLGRDGREAVQIGPLLAEDAEVERALLHDALLPLSTQPIYVDLLDTQRKLLPWLEQLGFAFQRPFTRMVHGTDAAPGEPAAIVLAAGPELG
jgi:GNAT superfamily N-acetyltransferase